MQPYTEWLKTTVIISHVYNEVTSRLTITLCARVVRKFLEDCNLSRKSFEGLLSTHAPLRNISYYVLRFWMNNFANNCAETVLDISGLIH